MENPTLGIFGQRYKGDDDDDFSNDVRAVITLMPLYPHLV